MLDSKIEIEFEVRKKQFILVLVVLLGVGLVFAYGGNQPTSGGHSVSEIDFGGGLPDNVKNQLIGEKGNKGAIGLPGDSSFANCVVEFGASTTIRFTTTKGQWIDCPANYIITDIYFQGSDLNSNSDVYRFQCREVKLRC